MPATAGLKEERNTSTAEGMIGDSSTRDEGGKLADGVDKARSCRRLTRRARPKMHLDETSVRRGREISFH
jgi:hypothetical protein